MKKSIIITLFLTATTLFAVFASCEAQTSTPQMSGVATSPKTQTTTYNGKTYVIETGSRGGKFITVPNEDGSNRKVYLASIITENANGTATYKGVDYNIITGERGGRYILLRDGTKHYLPKVN